MKRKDWTGTRFGNLVCIGKSPHRDEKGHVLWLMQCDCGSNGWPTVGRKLKQ